MKRRTAEQAARMRERVAVLWGMMLHYTHRERCCRVAKLLGVTWYYVQRIVERDSMSVANERCAAARTRLHRACTHPTEYAHERTGA